MEFHEILSEIMEEKGLNVATVARICGLVDGTVRSIIARKQKNVALAVAFKLSDGLGVSLERLNGMPEPKKKDVPSGQDETLLKLFHQLNEEGKERLLETADDLVQSGKYSPKNHPNELDKKA